MLHRPHFFPEAYINVITFRIQGLAQVVPGTQNRTPCSGQGLCNLIATLVSGNPAKACQGGGYERRET